jgi:hypothetical protein
MPPTCTICRHPQREAIDADLVSGIPFRHIAARTGTSTGALQRHKAGCLSACLVKASQAAEVANADDLLAKIRSLEQRANKIGAKAEKSGDLRVALLAVHELTRIVELMSRLMEAAKKVTEQRKEGIQRARIILESATPETDRRPRIAFELEQRH